MLDKLIIAPQIVVYKNILKDSKNILSSLNTEDSLFTGWQPWYEQGERAAALFDRSKNEEGYLKDIVNCVDLIKEDYFNDFEKEKGIWPSFIENWEELKLNKNLVDLDAFKYNSAKFNMYPINEPLMEYHVDEFPIANQGKRKRHVVTINFYLNDDYKGGEICAYDSISNKAYKYKPLAGDAVVMPSTDPFYHAVKNFNGPDRYFLRSFIDYDVEENKEWIEKNQINQNDLVKQLNEDSEHYIKNHLQTISIDIKEDEV